MVVICTLNVRDKSYSIRSWRRDTFQQTAWPVFPQTTYRQLSGILLTLREQYFVDAVPIPGFQGSPMVRRALLACVSEYPTEASMNT